MLFFIPKMIIRALIIKMLKASQPHKKGPSIKKLKLKFF